MDMAWFSSHINVIGTISAAICTLAVFSLLYKENPFYRLFEHIFIGLAVGYGIFMAWAEVLSPYWWDAMTKKGQWWWALALAGGAMFYFIYSKKNAWVSRLIIGASFGLGAGLAFQDFANTYLPMVSSSFRTLVPVPGKTLGDTLNNYVFVIILITTMAYFFFSIDHKSGPMRRTASLGRWFLMFAFGAMFGATVMSRMALFIGRMIFLSSVPVSFWYVVGVVIAVLITMWMIHRSSPGSPKSAGDGDTPTLEPVVQEE